MKQRILKLTAYVVLVVFTPLPMAWAGDEVPAVAQLPEGLRPVTDSKPFIGDKPSLPDFQSVPVTSPGFPQTSLNFLAESKTLSTGEKDASEKHPGITTGNLKDLVMNDSTLIWDPPFPAEDFQPVVKPTFNIEFRKPFDRAPLPGPLVNPALLEPPSLLQGEKVEIDVPLLEPPPLEKPVPLMEERSKFSGNAAASFVFSKKAKTTKEESRKGKVGKRNWHKRERKGRER